MNRPSPFAIPGDWPTHIVLPPRGRERGVPFTKALPFKDDTNLYRLHELPITW